MTSELSAPDPVESENVAEAPSGEISADETASDPQLPDAESAVSDNSTDAREAKPVVPADDAADQPKRRLRLNPTAGVGEFKPVPALSSALSGMRQPNQDSSNPAAPGAGSDESLKNHLALETNELAADVSEVSDKTGAVAAPMVDDRVESVELPPENIDLDAALEAEIAAALAADTEADAIDSEAAEKSESRKTTEDPVEEAPEDGARLKGTVQSIHGDDVFLELGYRSPGVVSLRQFETAGPPQIDQEVEVVVSRIEPDGLILVNLPTGVQRRSADWDTMETGQVVDCTVSQTNKGGLEVQIGNLRGFLPAGQVDLRYVDDLDQYLGQTLRVQIVQVNRQKHNLVVSRRAILAEERKAAEATFWETVELEQVFAGTVTSIKDYGAFVDLGATDGFLHIGQISWKRINHPSEILQVGQQAEVKVVSIDREKKRIGLSLKQLTVNPWSMAAEQYPVGKTVRATVVRTMDFGAFVELEPGVEGLVHISELDYRRVKKVTDILNVGQEIDVQVLSVDPDRSRIALSLKALMEKPEQNVPAESDEVTEDTVPDEPAAVQRKQPLKGGIGTEGGLLFGDPKDFAK